MRNSLCEITTKHRCRYIYFYKGMTESLASHLLSRQCAVSRSGILLLSCVLCCCSTISIWYCIINQDFADQFSHKTMCSHPALLQLKTIVDDECNDQFTSFAVLRGSYWGDTTHNCNTEGHLDVMQRWRCPPPPCLLRDTRLLSSTAHHYTTQSTALHCNTESPPHYLVSSWLNLSPDYTSNSQEGPITATISLNNMT